MNDIIPYWTWAGSLLALAVAYGAALATHELGEARAARRDGVRTERERAQRHVTRNT
jgi:hypothetical protein